MSLLHKYYNPQWVVRSRYLLISSIRHMCVEVERISFAGAMGTRSGLLKCSRGRVIVVKNVPIKTSNLLLKKSLLVQEGLVVVETKAPRLSPGRSNILPCSVHADARCTEELEEHIFSPPLPCNGKEPLRSSLADVYNIFHREQSQQEGQIKTYSISTPDH